jgi:hypothetical protein
MLNRILPLLLGIAILAGCTGYIPPRYDPVIYPNSYKNYDMALFWKVRATSERVDMGGFARNLRYARLRDLELTVTVMDRNNVSLASSTFLFIPKVIEMEATEPFSLSIPLQGGTPARLRFQYYYHFLDTEYGDHPYFYTFDAVLP